MLSPFIPVQVIHPIRCAAAAIPCLTMILASITRYPFPLGITFTGFRSNSAISGTSSTIADTLIVERRIRPYVIESPLSKDSFCKPFLLGKYIGCPVGGQGRPVKAALRSPRGARCSGPVTAQDCSCGYAGYGVQRPPDKFG
jgi:hypothetical protein